MDFIAHLFSAGLVWDEIRRLTGDGAFPAIALGIIGILWRAERAPWFTGRVALAVFAMGIVTVLIVSLLLAWQRVGDGELKVPERAEAHRNAGHGAGGAEAAGVTVAPPETCTGCE